MKLVKGIYFPDSDTHFENVIDDEGNYQRKQFDAVLKYIKPEDRGLFIDVGAHVGLWSRMAYDAGFNQFLCFDPDYENIECLKRNLENLPKREGFGAFFYRAALSDRSDRLKRFNVAQEKEGNSGAKTLKIEGSGFSHLKIFDELNFKIPADFIGKALIKIDVQGYEAKVVRGMTNFIKEYKPIIIVEQWLNGKEDLEATDYCLSLGMKILETVQKEVILGW